MVIRQSKRRLEVKKFIRRGQWNIDSLRQSLSEEMVDHITTYIKPNVSEVNEKACWMPETSGEFTVKSAF